MLDHPFICPLLHSFVTYEERCYVLPYAAGGSLREILRENGKLSPELIRFYLCEIVSGVTYLHELGITYHDLKPENILVDQTGHYEQLSNPIVRRYDQLYLHQSSVRQPCHW